jgi:hypothetical protein
VNETVNVIASIQDGCASSQPRMPMKVPLVPVALGYLGSSPRFSSMPPTARLWLSDCEYIPSTRSYLTSFKAISYAEILARMDFLGHFSV